MGMSKDGLAITPFLFSAAYGATKHLKAYTFQARYQELIITFRADDVGEAIQLAAHYFRTKQLKNIHIKYIKENHES